MNELQKALRQLLWEFTEVCRKQNLRYFLACGSALGAVKYQGFIPWDDDVDVAMPREDYERFLLEAPALLPEHFILQNYRTEPAAPQIYTKMRDLRTTCVENGTANLSISHGVFLDIFPLDGYPQNPVAQKLLELRKWHYKGQLACAYDLPRTGLTKLRCDVYRFFGSRHRTAKIAAKYDRMIRRYPCEGSSLICNHGNWQNKLEYAAAQQYGQGCQGEFEGLQVTIPQQYDAYLRQKYGDYTQDLPGDKQKSHHNFAVLDLEKPFNAQTKD